MKERKKRGPGRPKKSDSLSGVVRFRARPEVIAALLKYQERYKLLDQSEAARQALAAALKGEGLL